MPKLIRMFALLLCVLLLAGVAESAKSSRHTKPVKSGERSAQSEGAPAGAGGAKPAQPTASRGATAPAAKSTAKAATPEADAAPVSNKAAVEPSPIKPTPEEAAARQAAEAAQRAEAEAARKAALEAAARAERERVAQYELFKAKAYEERTRRASMLKAYPTVDHNPLARVGEEDRPRAEHLKGNRTSGLVVLPVGPLHERDRDHNAVDGARSYFSLDGKNTADCLVDGNKAPGGCGWMNHNWQEGSGLQFFFDKPVVLDAMRLHQQHCCGPDLFAMYGISNDGAVRQLLGNFTIPMVTMAHTRTPCGEHSFTVTWPNTAKFMRYEFSKLQGGHSGSPEIYEIEFPTQAELRLAQTEHTKLRKVAEQLWEEHRQAEAAAKAREEQARAAAERLRLAQEKREASREQKPDPARPAGAKATASAGASTRAEATKAGSNQAKAAGETSQKAAGAERPDTRAEATKAGSNQAKAAGETSRKAAGAERPDTRAEATKAAPNVDAKGTSTSRPKAPNAKKAGRKTEMKEPPVLRTDEI